MHETRHSSSTLIAAWHVGENGRLTLTWGVAPIATSEEPAETDLAA